CDRGSARLQCGESSPQVDARSPDPAPTLNCQPPPTSNGSDKVPANLIDGQAQGTPPPRRTGSTLSRGGGPTAPGHVRDLQRHPRGRISRLGRDGPHGRDADARALSPGCRRGVRDLPRIIALVAPATGDRVAAFG